MHQPMMEQKEGEITTLRTRVRLVTQMITYGTRKVPEGAKEKIYNYIRNKLNLENNTKESR